MKPDTSLLLQRHIDIKPLKKLATNNLTTAPNLRFLILSEKDQITIEEFLIKIDIWNRLLTEETSKGKT